MPDLEKELRARRERGRKLLIPYLMGGMTDDWTQSLAAVVAAGADAVEVGIPFSDPMMDGPVIQEAALRALDAGHGARRRSSTASRGPRRPVPVAVMTYYNLVFRAGHKRMARSLAAAGVSGAIIPDLPLEEIAPWAAEADAAGDRHRPAGGAVLAARPGGAHLRPGARLRLRRGPHGGDRGARRRSGRTWRRSSSGSGAAPTCPSASASACRRRTRRRRCARWPTAWWSARRWCAACSRTRGPTGRRPSSGRSGTPSTRRRPRELALHQRRRWRVGPPPSGARRATRSPAGSARPPAPTRSGDAQVIAPCSGVGPGAGLGGHDVLRVGGQRRVGHAARPRTPRAVPCRSRGRRRRRDTSTRVTFLTWWARASATAPATALFSAARTTWAAAEVLPALGLRPLHTRLVCRPEVAVPSAICDGSGMGW